MKRTVLTGVYSYKDKELAFNYYTSLKVTDKIRFLNYVIANLVDDEYYYSTLKDLVFDYAIIKMFTDIDTSAIDNAADTIGKIEEFLEETDIVYIVKENAEYGVIEELMDSVNKNIQYRTGIKSNSLEDALNHLLGTIENKVNEIDTEGMMKAAEMLGSISGELTADKVVSAYANSGLLQKRFDEVQAEKKANNVEMIPKTTKKKSKKSTSK